MKDFNSSSTNVVFVENCKGAMSNLPDRFLWLSFAAQNFQAPWTSSGKEYQWIEASQMFFLAVDSNNVYTEEKVSNDTKISSS